jgi:hypothetical protein
MFYVSAEFESEMGGRYRVARGFHTEAERDAFAADLTPVAGDYWSDYEEWEAPQEEWSHIRIG